MGGQTALTPHPPDTIWTRAENKIRRAQSAAMGGEGEVLPTLVELVLKHKCFERNICLLSSGRRYSILWVALSATAQAQKMSHMYSRRTIPLAEGNVAHVFPGLRHRSLYKG